MRFECCDVVELDNLSKQGKLTVEMGWPDTVGLVSKAWMEQVPLVWEEAAMVGMQEVAQVAVVECRD